MQNGYEKARQADEAVEAARKATDQIINAADSMHDKRGFRRSHSSGMTTGRGQQGAIYGRGWQHKKDGELNQYYVNNLNVAAPEDLARQVDRAYMAPVNETEAAAGYQEIDRWANPVLKSVKSVQGIGSGAYRRREMTSYIDDKKVADELRRNGASQDIIDSFTDAKTMQQKQKIIDEYNAPYRNVINDKLNDKTTGYHQRYTEANRSGKRMIVKEQKHDKELQNAKKSIINTRHKEIETMHRFHEDYVIDGTGNMLHSSKTLKEAEGQLTKWLSKDGINADSLSDRQIKNALAMGRIKGVKLDEQKTAELKELLKVREHLKGLDGVQNLKDSMKAMPKTILRETIGQTDTGKGYHIVKTGVKAAEMGASVGLTGVEVLTNASIGLTRVGAKGYDFAYRKSLDRRINKASPKKAADLRLKKAKYDKKAQAIQRGNERLRTAQNRLHAGRQKTTKFLNSSGGSKVKTVAKQTGKVATKAARGIDRLSGKIFGTRISQTRLGQGIITARNNMIARRIALKQRFLNSKIGKMLAKVGEKLASFFTGVKWAKLILIIGLAAVILLSAAGFMLAIQLGNLSFSMPGATAEDEGFLQSVVQDMQVRQDNYENYILYGQNESAIDTSKVHSNGTFVNSVERTDIDTSKGLASAKIPVDFTDNVRITEKTTTTTYVPKAHYKDVTYERESTTSELKDHVHTSGEVDPVCEGKNAKCVCKTCENFKKRVEECKKQGIKPPTKIAKHTCSYWLETTTKTTITKQEFDHYTYEPVSKDTTTSKVETRTVHGYANSTGLTAMNAKVSIPDGGTLSDAQIQNCETTVTYKFVDSQGKTQYVDSEGTVHTYDQADLYKAILSMATIALRNECSDKNFYEAYCFKLLDSVYNAGYSVNYHVSEKAGSNDVKWNDTTDITSYEIERDSQGRTTKVVTRTQDPTELSANSYEATAEVIIYLDSGITDMIKNDTTDNAWMRLNGVDTETYGKSNAGNYVPIIKGMKLTGYQDLNGHEIDMNDPNLLPDFWEGWKNSDGSYNDNYYDALMYYEMTNEDWRDFDVLLPGVMPEGVIFANVANQAEVAAYLKQCGFSDAGIAGIMGNIQQESNWNPMDSYGKYLGLCQWDIGGRWDNLLSYCSANGLDYTTTSAQISFMVYELPSRCPKVYEYLKTTDDVAMAAMEFAMGYEGCVRSTAQEYDLLYTGTLSPKYTNKIYLQEMKKRTDYANTYCQTLTTGGGMTSTGVVGDIPAITAPITNIHQQTAVAFALSKVGAQYSQAKRFQEGYFDCSSLCYRAWAAGGIDISYGGSTTAAGIAQGFYQNSTGRTVSFGELQPGDLVFYSRYSNGRFLNITHVAMYAGNGMVVEARDEKHGVVYREISKTGTQNVVLCGRPNYE